MAFAKRFATQFLCYENTFATAHGRQLLAELPISEDRTRCAGNQSARHYQSVFSYTYNARQLPTSMEKKDSSGRFVYQITFSY